ncbi:MAG: hypothetical protein Q9221_000523 [Calogaya cf. arnoldii]
MDWTSLKSDIKRKIDKRVDKLLDIAITTTQKACEEVMQAEIEAQWGQRCKDWLNQQLAGQRDKVAKEHRDQNKEHWLATEGATLRKKMEDSLEEERQERRKRQEEDLKLEYKKHWDDEVRDEYRDQLRSEFAREVRAELREELAPIVIDKLRNDHLQRLQMEAQDQARSQLFAGVFQLQNATQFAQNVVGLRLREQSSQRDGNADQYHDGRAQDPLSHLSQVTTASNRLNSVLNHGPPVASGSMGGSEAIAYQAGLFNMFSLDPPGSNQHALQPQPIQSRYVQNATAGPSNAVRNHGIDRQPMLLRRAQVPEDNAAATGSAVASSTHHQTTPEDNSTPSTHHQPTPEDNATATELAVAPPTFKDNATSTESAVAPSLHYPQPTPENNATAATSAIAPSTQHHQPTLAPGTDERSNTGAAQIGTMPPPPRPENARLPQQPARDDQGAAKIGTMPPPPRPGDARLPQHHRPALTPGIDQESLPVMTESTSAVLSYGTGGNLAKPILVQAHDPIMGSSSASEQTSRIESTAVDTQAGKSSNPTSEPLIRDEADEFGRGLPGPVISAAGTNNTDEPSNRTHDTTAQSATPALAVVPSQKKGKKRTLEAAETDESAVPVRESKTQGEVAKPKPKRTRLNPAPNIEGPVTRTRAAARKAAAEKANPTKKNPAVSASTNDTSAPAALIGSAAAPAGTTIPSTQLPSQASRPGRSKRRRDPQEEEDEEGEEKNEAGTSPPQQRGHGML